MCIRTVGLFGCDRTDINVSLTAVGQLWNIADYFGTENDSMLKALSLRDEAEGPLVEWAATELHAAQSPDGFQAPAPPSASASSEQVQVDCLWQTLFFEIHRSCRCVPPTHRPSISRPLWTRRLRLSPYSNSIPLSHLG